MEFSHEPVYYTASYGQPEMADLIADFSILLRDFIHEAGINHGLVIKCEEHLGERTLRVSFSGLSQAPVDLSTAQRSFNA